MRNYTIYKYIFWTVAVVLIYGFFFYNPTALSSTPSDNALTINVLPLKPQDVETTSQYVGYITPIKSVDLVPNVSGYIDEVWAEGGQNVAEGDNLILIDQRQYKAQLDAATAAVAQAKADYVNAKSYFNRVKKAGKKAISASDMDDAKAKFLAAEAALKQAQAEEQKALVLYDYTVLQAPINGTIGNVSLTKGNYVAPSDKPLLSIIQFDPIRVMFAISDKEYLTELQKSADGKLFANEDIKLRLANGDIYENNGKFRFADNQIDKTTNSVSIFADFENKNRKLIANSYVDVLLSRKMNDVYLIRQNYAILGDRGAFVYVMQNNKLKQVPLKIVGYFEDSYVVANKFANNEFLVTDKIGKIADGTRLKMKIANLKMEKK
ncbi:MAG: efflux RND transporter periplasmic adaptor subunit [Alphaproteobacteria bacterium]|nr:efflux RND transporter periplasmic adaptor subunit [Alphaproteobacteria bacterium]